MTAFDPSYRDDPRYQRKLRSIDSKGDEYIGLVKAFMTDAAGRHMDKMLTLARLGAEEKRGKEALAFGGKRLDTMSDLRRKSIESGEKRAERRADISERALALDTAREGRRLDVAEDIYDYNRKQLPWEIGISAAGIPVQYLTGRREAKERKEQKDMRKKIYDMYANSALNPAIEPMFNVE